MPFTRQWDGPKTWDRWESDDVTWVVQDLDPADYDEARKLLLSDLVEDEVLCVYSKLGEDPTSLEEASEMWREFLAQGTSLACYAEENGQRTLVAVNCCIVTCAGEKINILEMLKGKALINVLGAMDFLSDKVDVFKLYGVDKLLYGMGLVVRRSHRGARLGSKLLAARERLCSYLNIHATSTVFTGAASQRSAARAGLHTLADVTLKELAHAGFQYPVDEHTIKLMGTKYHHK